MKIVVAIKQVPARDSLLKVDAAGTWIEDADLSWEINEPDAYALEAGLQLREAATGEVVVLCAGPERATQTIREALRQRCRSRHSPVTPQDTAADPLSWRTRWPARWKLKSPT